MKYILMFVLSSVSLVAYADINKCEIEGKLVFQESPCPVGTKQQFELTPDISQEKQQAASKKLEGDIERWEGERQVKKKEEDKERKIKAAEEFARNIQQKSGTKETYDQRDDDSVGVRYGVDYPVRKLPLIKNKLPLKRPVIKK